MMVQRPMIMTAEEVADYLRVSLQTVLDWAERGVVPAGKLDEDWRFKRSEIERWVDDHLGGPTVQKAGSRSLRLADLLVPERVIRLRGTKKNEVLEELLARVVAAPAVTDPDAFRRAIHHREEVMSTGIGLGIAVPHGRLASVRDLVLAIGVHPRGIPDYESLDGHPVRIVCMMAAGDYQHEEYLRILAAISAGLKRADMREALVAEEDAARMITLLSEGLG